MLRAAGVVVAAALLLACTRGALGPAGEGRPEPEPQGGMHGGIPPAPPPAPIVPQSDEEPPAPSASPANRLIFPPPSSISASQSPFFQLVAPTALWAEQDSCIDRELVRRGLNQYGDPPTTRYVGGSPLFVARVGRPMERHAYVIQRHPEIGAACTSPTR